MTTTPTRPAAAGAARRPSPRWRRAGRATPHTVKTQRRAAAMFAPSMLASVVFVYIFIGTTVFISLSTWTRPSTSSFELREPFGATYLEMFGEQRFQADYRNVIVFTVFFLLLSVVGGLVVALAIHHVVVAKGLFRTVFLMPYALSFIVTGVAWRWIFQPSTGVNEILRELGIENPPGWTTDTTILAALNEPTGLDFIKIQFGIPVALLPIIFAAGWQLVGFAMALYLAGLGSIPDEHLEAANVDGANGWQRLRFVVLPQLWPSTVTALVLLLHVALKIFDLVVAMSGSGPGFVTDMPGLYIYSNFVGRYDKSSAMSIVLLVLTLVVVVPYLLRGYRRDRKAL